MEQQQQQQQEEDELGSLESFLKWAGKLGISDSSSSSSSCSCLGHSLYVSNFRDAGGRGLAAARDLRRGELILRVPKGALMTRASLLNKDPNFAFGINRHPSHSSSQILAILLLAEVGKGRRSLWYPYLLQLPRSYDILSGFGSFESKAFQVDYAVWTAERAMSRAELQWREAIPLMEELRLKPRLTTFKAWLWASATISSRTLHIPWDDAGCLCPVGDFFNYAAPGEDSHGLEDMERCRWASFSKVCSFKDKHLNEHRTLDAEEPYETSSSAGRLTDGGYEENIASYCFYAKKSYRKGEQVLLSYGTYTNMELLEHYGFLLDQNPNDKVFIPLPLGADIIMSSGKWSVDSLYIDHNGRASFALLCALRLWATPANQRRGVGRYVFSGSQLSPQNEIAVMQWIASKCKTMLQSLPSRVEDDLQLLEAIEFDDAHVLWSLAEEAGKHLPSAVATELNDFLCSNPVQHQHGGDNSRSDGKKVYEDAKRSRDKWKLAVQWRLGYKKVLVDCISFCSQTIQTLSAPNVLSQQ